MTDTVEQIVGRLGLPELGGSYFTFSNENNYMIWTFLKKCWEKGWLYRGADVMPWCPRCATGISQHEIVTDGYAELTHRSGHAALPAARARERIAAGLDHHALDAHQQRGRRRRPGLTYVKVTPGRRGLLPLQRHAAHAARRVRGAGGAARAPRWKAGPTTAPSTTCPPSSSRAGTPT